MKATFWLLDAPHSLHAQSHRMPDGTGLGWFSPGDEPVRDRAPLPAHRHSDFARHARNVVSHTFVSHLRYASTGSLDVRNAHPFHRDHRLFAHNGVVKDLDLLASWLAPADRAGLEGETDSEMVFAYITAEIRRHGDTTAGLIAAVRRMAGELPVYSLNLLLAEPRRLWALRYPESNPLWVLSPEVGGFGGMHRLASDHEPGRLEVSTLEPEAHRPVPAYVVASEPMDHDSPWRSVAPGELLIIDGLTARSMFPFDRPAHQLTEADLSDKEASSQEGDTAA